MISAEIACFSASMQHSKSSAGTNDAGHDLPSGHIRATWATLVELVRSVADFIMAPVMQRVATLSGTAHSWPPN